MRKTFKILGWLALACIPVASVILLLEWIHSDEPALDYSPMTVEMGPADPELNRYTLIRQFSETYEVTGIDDEMLDLDTPRPLWNAQTVKSAIDENESLLLTFSEAFKKESFLFDQKPTPEVSTPEVGNIRDYFKLRIWKTRQSHQNSDLQQLIALSKELETFSGQKGGLVHLLTAIAIAAIIEKEYYRLLEEPIPPENIREFSGGYQIPEIWTSSTQDAFKQEFWFASHCIDMIQANPLEVIGELSETSVASNNRFLPSNALFKVNRTKNTFFNLYSEIVRETPNPALERNLPLNQSMEAFLENRPRTWWLSRNVIGNICYAIIIPATGKVSEVADLRTAHGRLLRIAYALKNFYANHKVLPETLSALTPEYILEIPLDPFDGKELRYLKEAGIVYSVGNDFIDNRGSKLPFNFTLAFDHDEETAELDRTEPTIALRFLPKYKKIQAAVHEPTLSH